MKDTNVAFRQKLLELAELQGKTVRQFALRPDCRQLRLFLDDEHLLQVSVAVGDDGNASLALDLVDLRGLEPAYGSTPGGPAARSRGTAGAVRF